MRLRALAPGKVNLALFLGPERPDGRHQLVTIFESVSLSDEIVLAELSPGHFDEVVCSGVSGSNLAAEALSALRRRGWEGPPLRVEIDKRVPIAAGMGGGSADAAAVLRMACELAPGRPEEVSALAAELGADVPSQLVPGVSLGTGAGDLIEPLSPLAPHALVIVPLPVPLSTAAVYREADRLGLFRAECELERLGDELLRAFQPGAEPRHELLVNDLQPAAISLCPAIEDALAATHEAGAEVSLVSGSGPTVAGLFWAEQHGERAAAAAHKLQRRYPEAKAVVPVGPEHGAPIVV
jgi:4-diphosphocytidyl-2-C-methyl-D-erythritol kinase